MTTVREVDAVEEQDVIEHLHTDLFGGGKAAVPDLTEGYWWIAYDGDVAVGFAGLVHSPHYPKSGYLCRAGVSERAQGRGLQKRLIRARLSKARRLGWPWVQSDTHSRNPASANSLIACRFKMFVPEKKWGGRDHVYWQRRL